MPLTTPTHVNPFVDGVDAHSPSPASSSQPQSPRVSSSRPLVSSGPLGSLTSHSARTQGTPSRSTNPFDSPRLGANPFDSVRVSNNPFATPTAGANSFDAVSTGNNSFVASPVSTNLFDAPKVGTNPFDTPRVDTNRFGSSRIGTGSVDRGEQEHVSSEGLREEHETPNTAHAIPGVPPRADTTAAFARLRNRHGQQTPSLPNTPHPDAASRDDETETETETETEPEAEAEAELANAEHEELSAAQPHNGAPHPAPNSAVQLAEGTMEQTSELMSPMIQAQMFAAQSQMMISMVQAQLDVAKAAASAVADAARKS